jgi:hypothetical protein
MCAALSCCAIPVHGQALASADVRFAGCYQITSEKWHPMNEDASPIPSRFQLRSEPADKRSTTILQMRRIPAGNSQIEKLWIWQAKGDRLWLSWGTGFGGFRGTLNQSGSGEFVGKVKEWCDSHCEWKKRVGTIRIQKTECQN